MLENAIETYLHDKMLLAGGLCMKFNSTGNNGVPDRICLLNGNVIFVELKRPVGGVVRPDQVAMQASMRTRGATVLNINSKQQCDELIAMMKERAGHGGW